MRNISNEFRSRLYNDDYRNYVEDIYITLSDGTELRLTNENLWGYGHEAATDAEELRCPEACHLSSQRA